MTTQFKSHSLRKTKTLQGILTSRFVCKVAAVALAFFFFFFRLITHHVVTSQKNTVPQSVSPTLAFVYNIYLALGTSFQFVTVSFSPVSCADVPFPISLYWDFFLLVFKVLPYRKVLAPPTSTEMRKFYERPTKLLWLEPQSHHFPL